MRDGTIFRKDQEAEIAKRKSRSERLSPFKIRGFSTLRILDYCGEAEDSFINGCFRSCIICSAVAVELALKHTLIFYFEEWEETYWEIEVKKLKFSKVIERLRQTGKFGDILRNADWLREVRNQVVAHPLYIGNPFEMTKPGHLEPKGVEQEIWACNTMLRDIKKLLRFVEPEKRKEIEEKKISKKSSHDGKTLEEFSVKDLLGSQELFRHQLGNFLYWKAIQNELIEEIAFLAYKRMVETINVLFPQPSTANVS